MQQGLLTKIISWGTHPTYSEGTSIDWFAGLILVLLISFLWARVTQQLAE
jgi:hypothetical protein